MIQLTVGQLRDPKFLAIMQRIYQAKMPVPVSQKVLKILKALDVELAQANKQFLDLAKRHLQERSDEPGAFDLIPGNEHEQAMQDFVAAPVEVDLPRLSFEDLSLDLSPADVSLLEGLIGE